MKIIKLIFMAAALTCLLILISGCKGKTDENNIPANVKVNNDTVTVKEGSSKLKSGDNLKWPDKLMANIPELKCKITAVLKDDKTEQCTVVFAELGNEDAKAYLEKLKSKGFSGGMELQDENSIMFSGTDRNGSQACFTYNTAAKEGSVSYEPKAGADSEEKSEN